MLRVLLSHNELQDSAERGAPCADSIGPRLAAVEDLLRAYCSDEWIATDIPACKATAASPTGSARIRKGAQIVGADDAGGARSRTRRAGRGSAGIRQVIRN